MSAIGAKRGTCLMGATATIRHVTRLRSSGFAQAGGLSAGSQRPCTSHDRSLAPLSSVCSRLVHRARRPSRLVVAGVLDALLHRPPPLGRPRHLGKGDLRGAGIVGPCDNPMRGCLAAVLVWGDPARSDKWAHTALATTTKPEWPSSAGTPPWVSASNFALFLWSFDHSPYSPSGIWRVDFSLSPLYNALKDSAIPGSFLAPFRAAAVIASLCVGTKRIIACQKVLTFLARPEERGISHEPKAGTAQEPVYLTAHLTVLRDRLSGEDASAVGDLAAAGAHELEESSASSSQRHIHFRRNAGFETVCRISAPIQQERIWT